MCVMVRHKLGQSLGRAVCQYVSKCQYAFPVISQKSYILMLSEVILVSFFKTIQDALGKVALT